MSKIPFHIISGFLGSGKTTFLKRILEKYSGDMRIGVIQNEYAPANIDGEELKKATNDFQLLEINNGSVFCVCLLGGFVRSLEKFIDEINPEIIIMEASGLSDTTSVSEILSAGSIGEKIFLSSNWCVVDAINYEKTGLMKQRITHQLRMADIVIINKTDLLTNSSEPIKNEIKTINPFADIAETQYCDIDFISGKTPKNKFYFNKVNPMERPNINSMVIKSTKKLNHKSMELFFQKWATKAYRIKGFVNLKNGDTFAVQCTFNDINLKSVGKSYHPTELIAITSDFT
ncbi:MAG: GTP-binding protein, partial [Mariniphaga sp.]|nr:GTP-binding protein [Mariniphaga sp.]